MLSHITKISLHSSLLVMNCSITQKFVVSDVLLPLNICDIKNTYCITLNNKLDGYVRPQIIVLLLKQKDVQLCNDYKSFSQLFRP